MGKSFSRRSVIAGAAAASAHLLFAARLKVSELAKSRRDVAACRNTRPSRSHPDGDERGRICASELLPQLHPLLTTNSASSIVPGRVRWNTPGRFAPKQSPGANTPSRSARILLPSSFAKTAGSVSPFSSKRIVQIFISPSMARSSEPEPESTNSIDGALEKHS